MSQSNVTGPAPAPATRRMEAPSVYSNAVAVAVSGYDVMLRFLLDMPTEGDVKDQMPVADVRLAHGNAWSVAHMILKSLEHLVADQGMFAIPRDVVERLGLEDEYEALRAKAR